MTNTTRRSLFAMGLSIAAAVAMAAAPALAQDKLPPLSEDKPVVLISGSGPGSGPDTMARAFMSVAAKYTDQAYVVEHHTGGSGLVAVNNLFNRADDGLAVLLWTRSYAINHLTQPDVPSYLDDLAYIGIGMYAPLVVFTQREGSQFADASAMFEDCKAKEGSQKWGGPFAGSVDWLMVQIVWEGTGCKGQYIPFDDGASLAAAVMGKHVPVGTGDMGDVVSRADRLRPLVVATESRDERLSNVPTFKELGWDLVEQQHRGFVASKDIPDEARDFHHQVLELVLADPEWAEFINKQVALPGSADSAKMEEIAKSTEATATRILTNAGVIK